MRAFSGMVLVVVAGVLAVLGDPKPVEAGLLFAQGCFGVIYMIVEAS